MYSKDGEDKWRSAGMARLAAQDPMAAAIGAIDSALKLVPAVSDADVAAAIRSAVDRALVAVDGMVPVSPEALIVPPGEGRIPGPATTARAFAEAIGIMRAPTEGARLKLAHARDAVAMGYIGRSADIEDSLRTAKAILRVACVDARSVSVSAADAALKAWDDIAPRSRRWNGGARLDPR
jgi:hypothetical protein